MQLICYNIVGDKMYIIEYNPKDIKPIDFNVLGQKEYKILNNEDLSEDEVNYFLTALAYRVRLGIGETLYSPCINMCDISQAIICNYLNKLGVANHPCMTQNTIVSNITGHSFVTAQIKVNGKDKVYLIDPTYQQFLLKSECGKDKIFYHDGQVLIKPSPGYYLKEEEYPIIENFISRGFSELTEEFAAIYGNSFYNTKLGRVPNPHEYKSMPGSIYIKTFTKGNEKLSMSNLELKEASLEIHLSTDLVEDKIKNNL